MLGTEPTEDARNQPEHGSHWPAYELAGASTNIDTTGGVDPGWNGAGWVEVDYGISGNVASFTVHGQCHDNGALECSDSTGTLTSRIEHFREACSCAEEQHYRYRWDELNRLVDGLRYDRATGGNWSYGAHLRYRYDGANQRTVKQSYAATDLNTPERYALYVYPGDFERRGLTLGFGTAGPTYLATTGTADATETQYLIAGARIVWDGAPSIGDPDIDRNRRATVNASDLLGTTAASLDLESGALLEVSTYYPNGARENLWTNEADVPLEPMGFTGKEADEEIGVTYFGERWLIPRLGRWATPDPLHVHASGGGEALNSYHYVSGDLMLATDSTGLGVGDSTAEHLANPHSPDAQASREAGRSLTRLLAEYVYLPTIEFFTRTGQRTERVCQHDTAGRCAAAAADEVSGGLVSAGEDVHAGVAQATAPGADPEARASGTTRALIGVAVLGVTIWTHRGTIQRGAAGLRNAMSRLGGRLEQLRPIPTGVRRSAVDPSGPQTRLAPTAHLANYLRHAFRRLLPSPRTSTIAVARGLSRSGRPTLIVGMNRGETLPQAALDRLMQLADEAGADLHVVVGEFADGGLHAEMRVARLAEQEGITLYGIAADNHICPDCQDAIRTAIRELHPEIAFDGPVRVRPTPSGGSAPTGGATGGGSSQEEVVVFSRLDFEQRSVKLPSQVRLVWVEVAGRLVLGRTIDDRAWYCRDDEAWESLEDLSLVAACPLDRGFVVLSTDRVVTVPWRDTDVLVGGPFGNYGEAAICPMGSGGRSFLAATAGDAGAILVLVSGTTLEQRSIVDAPYANCALLGNSLSTDAILSLGDGPGTWEHYRVDSLLQMSRVVLPRLADPCAVAGDELVVLLGDELVVLSVVGGGASRIIAPNCRHAYDLGRWLVVDSGLRVFLVDKETWAVSDSAELDQLVRRVSEYGGRCASNAATGQICGMVGPDEFVCGRVIER